MKDQVNADVAALRKIDPESQYIDALASYPYMMKPDDVAGFLGLTRQAVTRLLREGSMRGVKSGSAWRVSKYSLIRFLKDNENLELG